MKVQKVQGYAENDMEGGESPKSARKGHGLVALSNEQHTPLSMRLTEDIRSHLFSWIKLSLHV